ncbi:tRNA (adenosine(37)-N6)-threonylcarbamoyltransferase complex ATPase subunit type 1 TsaE [Candidatus Wolfebacteria bacterium]|nr:MAG: tRNA (adenosine(37)-N6)-threonylcarbamoyltransferase complex ATPase subunit type 1 TsaE [Candidatus Wolfebacteria bacterium]
MISHGLDETRNIAKDFVDGLSVGNGATVVGLAGDLGSGKTTFVQAVAEALGVGETVTSPTFVIMKVYKLPSTNYQLLIHIDAYRLESAHELEVLGWDNIVSDPKNLILIEWPENVEDILEKDIQKIDFKFVSENEREINIHGK